MEASDTLPSKPSGWSRVRLLLLLAVVVLVLLTMLPRIFADHADLATRLTRQSTIAERRRALAEMAALDAPAKQNLLPELRTALSDKNPQVRQNAAETLGELDQTAIPAREDLKRLRQDSVPDVRRAAAVSLARMGQPDDALVLDLSRDLQAEAPDDNVSHQTEAKLRRYAAANALGFIASGSNPMDVSASLPALIQTVTSDPDSDVRNRAAWALGSMGKRAQNALPALALASQDPKVSSTASWAIDRIRK